MDDFPLSVADLREEDKKYIRESLVCAVAYDSSGKTHYFIGQNRNNHQKRGGKKMDAEILDAVVEAMDENN